MINKKEKYLKNYLNYENLKKSLLKQQNELVQSFNKEISNKNSKNSSNNIEPDINYYKNISPIQNCNNIIIPIENNNIYKIRLSQTKETLIELSKIKWPDILISKNILDLKGNVNKIILLLFKAFRKKKL